MKKSFCVVASILFFILFASFSCSALEEPTHEPIQNFNGSIEYEGDILIDKINTIAVAIGIDGETILKSTRGNITLRHYRSLPNNLYPNSGIVFIGKAGSKITIIAKEKITLQSDYLAAKGVSIEQGLKSVITLTAPKIEINLTYDSADSGVNVNNTNESSCIIASNNGHIILNGDTKLTTVQERGYGIWTNTTNSGDGVFVQINGNTTIETEGDGSYGFRMMGGTVEINGDLSVTTRGERSYGDSGFTSYGAYGASVLANSELIVNGKATIVTEGARAHGLYAYPGKIRVNSLDITTSGSTAHGLYIYASSNNTSNMTVEKDAAIATSGQGSHGVYNYSLSTGTSITNLNGNAKIDTFKNSSHGIYNTGTNAVLTINHDAIITSSKNSAHAIYNASGTTTLKSTAQIKTSGNSSYGINVSGGTLNIQDKAEVTTQGTESYGVYASGNSTANLVGEYNEITTNSENSHAIYLNNGTTVNLGENTKVIAKGANASAMYFAGSTNIAANSYKSLTMKSEQYDLITNAKGKTVEVSFTGSSELYGDVQGLSNNSSVKMILEDYSSWEGSAKGLSSNNSEINLYLEDSSKWLIGKDSFLTLLNMNSQVANAMFLYNAEDDLYHTIELSQLSGHGLFTMNVNANLGYTNFITSKYAEGEFELKLISKSNQGGVEELQLVAITEETDPNVEFKLYNDAEKVQLGSYYYELESRINNQEWWLVRLALDEKIPEDGGKAVFGLFEFAKAVNATLSDDFLRPRNKIWLISYYKIQKFDLSIASSDLKQQIGGGIAGFDKKLSDSFSVGMFFGLNLGYQNIGQNSIGHISNLTAGTYLDYKNHGFSLNAYARVSDYIHDLRLKGTLGADVNGTLYRYGFSTSVEISQRITLLNIYIEPKGKLFYTWVSDDTVNIGGMEFNAFAEKGLVTWLGVKLGILRDKEEYEKPYEYYLEAGWIHDTNPSVTYLAPEMGEDAETITIGKNRFEVGIGFETSPLDQSKFSLEFKYAKGEGITEPVKLKMNGSCFF